MSASEPMSSTFYANTQGGTQRRLHIAPQIRAAGVAGDYSLATVADLCSSFNPSGISTPDLIHSFHHRGGDVGKSHRHWARANDPCADPNVCYGVRGNQSGNMDECLKPDVYADRVHMLIGEQREKNYLSNMRKPLSRTPAAKDPISIPLQGFGVSTKKGDTVHGVLNSWRDVEAQHRPGEQVDRNYNWEESGIDPVQHRFGIRTVKSESAKAVMRPDYATHLMPKMVKDYKSTTDSEVGKPKCYGFDDPSKWDASKRGGNGSKSTGNALETQPTLKELLSTWVENPHTAAQHDGPSSGQHTLATTRTDGGQAFRTMLPREDAAEIARRGGKAVTLSVLDDEATVHQLVNPCHYVKKGVASKYFAGGRDIQGIRELCFKCDFGLSEEGIDTVFTHASREGKCGIEQFKNKAVEMGFM